MPSDMNEIRGKINTIDDQILKLFTERMEASAEIAAFKVQNALPLLDKAREREILARVMDAAGENEQYAFQLFTTLFELSKAKQSRLYAPRTDTRTRIEASFLSADEVFPKTGSIACQGVEGAYSQEACDKLLPRGNIVYVKTFEAVFDAVGSGLCRFGVLPVENSSNGSVRSVYELLQKKKYSIVRSTNLWVHHELLALPGAKLSDIKEIYSHEQAIGQCSKFLATLTGADIIPCGNTAMAAKMLMESKNPHAAAISSNRCAELYGLSVLKSNIQDSDNNYTRFICIAKEPAIYAGADRISLIIGCPNQPGALHSILANIAAHGVNMSKLESSPVVGSNFEFHFFVDLDASVREPGILPMLDDLERISDGFVFLGNYQIV